jgi:hypothetical protein
MTIEKEELMAKKKKAIPFGSIKKRATKKAKKKKK